MEFAEIDTLPGPGILFFCGRIAGEDGRAFRPPATFLGPPVRILWTSVCTSVVDGRIDATEPAELFGCAT